MNKREKVNQLAISWVNCKCDKTKREIEKKIINSVTNLINYYVGKSGVTQKKDLRQSFFLKTLSILKSFDPQRACFLTYLTNNLRKARQEHIDGVEVVSGPKYFYLRKDLKIKTSSLNEKPVGFFVDEFIDQIESSDLVDYDDTLVSLRKKNIINNEEMDIINAYLNEGLLFSEIGKRFNKSRVWASGKYYDGINKIRAVKEKVI
jgi:hypothetical protein